ncbi:hypothetical protein B0O99DRAFT_631673 [Bisporella sp. PMI_857]|nr:hypothetical protein B0O99DRAFT_631673 [Bisporella sp. PMI_857]
MSSQVTNTNWLKRVASPKNAKIDIIAVHGMNLLNTDGHADNTWTDENSGKNWLEHFLPSRIPYARILAYQYNANIAFGTSSAGVEQQAMNLLNFLSLERKIYSARPIIFIAHSMGGIIVKQALVTAFHGDGTNAMIPTITYGIVFFGVPHKGSEWAARGRFATRIGFKFNESFLKSVEQCSAVNDTLTTKFKPILEKYNYISICETVPVKKGGMDFGIIVDRDSATLGLDDSKEVKLFPNRSHTTICKFGSDEEPEWEQVSGFICGIAESAIKFYNYSPIILEGEKRPTSCSYGLEGMEEQSIPRERVIEGVEELLESINEDSESSNQLREAQMNVGQLFSNITYIFVWLLPYLEKILSSFLPFHISSLALPSKTTVMDMAEEVRQTQQHLVELEEIHIQTLDTKLHYALHATGMLQNVIFSETSSTEDDIATHQLHLASQLYQQLHKQAEKITREMYLHSRTCDKEKNTLKKIEAGQKEAEGKDAKGLYLMIAERAQQEKAGQDENRENGNNRKHCCIMM